MTASVVHRVADLRSELAMRPRPLHLVPTMGALHAGHVALLGAARAEAATVVMSVFVNPLQFNDAGDLARYPRALEADVAAATAAGVDVVWCPEPDEMYPGGRPQTTVCVGRPAAGFEGEHRPGHFEGVATVVAKLFHQSGCDAAWFGRKDAQQLAVVRCMVADLDFPVSVREHPTVREPDGLALSSRNALLSPPDRRLATALSAGLVAAADRAAAGERGAGALVEACRQRAAELGLAFQYAALVDGDSFNPLPSLGPPARRAVLAVAAQVGPVRLIDNITFEIGPGDDIRADRGMLTEASV